jgi:hypothetical protein
MTTSVSSIQAANQPYLVSLIAALPAGLPVVSLTYQENYRGLHCERREIRSQALSIPQLHLFRPKL